MALPGPADEDDEHREYEGQEQRSGHVLVEDRGGARVLVISRELAEHDDVVARGRAGHHEAHEPEGVRDLLRGKEGSATWLQG